MLRASCANFRYVLVYSIDSAKSFEVVTVLYEKAGNGLYPYHMFSMLNLDIKFFYFKIYPVASS
jgi:hypothetical protein